MSETNNCDGKILNGSFQRAPFKVFDSFCDKVVSASRGKEYWLDHFDVFSYFFLLRKIFNRLISGNCEMNFSWLLKG